MKGFRVAASAALLLLAACSTEIDRTNEYDVKSDPSDQAGAEVSGRITLEGETDHSNIEVILRGPTKTDISTDASGAFVINELTPGDYEVTLSFRGFEVLTEQATLTPGQVLDFGEYDLAVSRAEVRGQLTAADDDVVLAGASVSIQRTESARGVVAAAAGYYAAAASQAAFNRYEDQQVVGSNGVFVFGDLPVGVYQLVIQQTDAGTVVVEVRVTAKGDDVVVDPIALSSISGDFTIAGTLVDASESNTLTADPDVVIKLVADGAAKMRIGQEQTDGSCDFGVVENFTVTRPFTLTGDDGIKTICVELQDNDGNKTDELRSSIVLDTQAPSLNLLRVNGGVEYSTSTNVLLEVVALDSGSGVEKMTHSHNGGAAITEDFRPVFDLNAGGQGSHSYTVTVIDRAGHESAPLAGTVVVDSIDPAIVQFDINGGVTAVTPGLVNVQLDGNDASPLQMKLWIGDENSASYVPFVTQTTVSFPQQDGVFLVGLRLRDAAGNESAPQIQAVTIDYSPPQNPTVRINSDATYANTTAVSLALSAVDAAEMRISQSPTFGGASWEAYGTGKAISLAAVDGSQTVYVQYRDTAGNQSETASDSIVLDTTPPTIASFSIGGGAAFNTDPAGQFNLAQSAIDTNGVDAMRIDTGTSCAASSAGAEPFVTTKVQAYANAGAGVEEAAYACIQVQDRAGNWSAEVSASVQYDTQAPIAGVPAVVVAGGASVTSDTVIAVALDAAGATEMQVSLDSGFAGSAWVSFTTATNIALNNVDGLQTVYARFRDAAGNTTLGSNDTVTVDRSAPTSFSVTAPTAVSGTSLNVQVTGLDAHGPVQVRLSEDPGFGGAGWTNLASPHNVSLSGGTGNKTIYVQLRDAAGNETAIRTHTVSVDSTAPQNPALSIQQGDYVGDTAVTLVLTVEDSTEVRLSEASDFSSGAGWQPYSLTKGFALSAGNGGKYVYAQYRDGADNRSAAVSATTILDTIDPVVSQYTVNGGSANAAPGAVTLQLMGTDATPLQMKLWVDDESAASYGPYITSTSVVIPAVDGAHTVGLRLRDAAGNESNPSLAILTIDSTPPTLASVSINSGDAITNATGVSLSLGASGADEVRISESPTFGGASWAATAGTVAFTLGSGDGNKTVYVQYRDNAGNLGDIVSDSIVLDTTAPSAASVLINSGAAYSNDVAGLLSLGLTGIDASGITHMRLGSDAGSCVADGSVEVFNTSKVLTYANAGAGVEETAHVCLQVRDAAGNWSATVSDTISYDTQAPTVDSFVLDGGNILTTALNVTAEVSASGSATLMRISTGGGCASGTWEGFSGLKTVSLGEGSNTRSVQLQDAAGNTSGCVAQSITVDSIGPNTPGVTIAESLTNSTTINLTLFASGADLLEISEDVGFLTVLYQGATTGTTAVTLSAGDGSRTIYARFSDAAGNESAIASDSVVIDTTAPDAGVAIGGGVYNTDVAGQLSLTINGTDANGVSLMRIDTGTTCDASGVSSEAYASTKVHTYANAGAGVEETAYVCVQVRDGAGNWSAEASASVQYDTQAPSVGAPAITLAGGAAVTRETVVAVALDAAGADEMQLSTDSGFAGAAWVGFTTATEYVFGGADGTKTLHVRYRDTAGNTTLGSNDTVALDRTAPTGISLSGPSETSNTTITLNLSGSDGQGVYVTLDEDPAFTASAPQTLAGAMAYTITGAGDGLKTIYALIADGVGNEASVISHSLVLDQSAPTAATVSIAEGDYTTDQDITLQLGVDDADEVRFNENSDLSGASWQSLGLSKIYTTTGGEGTKTVYVQYRDTAGNTSSIVSASIYLDESAPGTPTVVIAEGTATNSREITLGLTFPSGDEVEMQVSEQNSFAGAAWVSITTTVNYTLTSGSGSKTVYVRSRDTAGQNSAAGSDNINLDTSGPGTPLVTLDGGAGTSTSRTVAVALSNSADATDMLISDNPAFSGASWESFNAVTSYTFAADGIATLYVMYRDNVGNESAAGSDSIAIDTGVPGAGQILIDSGADYSTDTGLTLTLFSSGADEMRFAEDPNMLGASSWQAYSTSYAYTITTAGEGTKTVYAEFKDSAGNVSDVVSDAIIYDGTAPGAGTGIQIANGATYTTNALVTVSLDIPADATEMILADNTGFAGSSWQSTDTEVSWNLGSSDGTKTLYAKWRDAAGNPTAIQSDSVEMDTEAPAPGANAIVINGGAQYSNATNSVSVTFDAVGATQMAVADNPGFEDPLYEGIYAVSGSLPVPITDGTYELFVVFADAAGNISTVRSDSITLDRSKPVLSQILVNEQSAWTQVQDIRVQLFGYDENQLNQVVVSDGVVTAAVPYVPSFVIDSGLSEGESASYTVWIEDVAGNISDPLTSQTITRDSTPPAVGSPTIVINDGDIWATEQLADVDIDYGQASELKISGNAGLAGASWQPVTDYISWNLGSGDGNKSVYVRFRDQAGNETGLYSSSISLDTTPPSNADVEILVGGDYINFRTVWTELQATGAYAYAVTVDPAFENPVTGLMSGGIANAMVTFPTQDGEQHVYALFFDEAGNASTVVDEDIIVDLTPPDFYYAEMLNGRFDYYVNSPYVQIALYSYDENPLLYAQADTVATFDSPATQVAPFGTSVYFYNPVSGAESTLYMRTIDAAGNYSAAYPVTMFVDVTAPTGDVLLSTPALTNNRTIGFYFDNVSNDTLEYQVNEAGVVNPNAWKVFESNYEFTIANWDGTHDLYFWLRDVAGNQSEMYQRQVTLDTDEPVITSFDILENDVTNVTSWTVAFTGSGADYVEIAENPGFVDADQYAGGTTDFDIDGHLDGAIILYGRLCDTAGNCSNLMSDSAVLDTQAPQAATMAIGQGDFANQPVMDILMSGEGAYEYAIGERSAVACDSLGAWTAFASQVTYEVGALKPSYILDVKLRDAAGNATACLSDIVYADISDPVFSLSVSGTEGVAGKTAEQLVVLNITASDDLTPYDNLEIQVANDISFIGADWLAVTDTMYWVINPGDGIRTVYMNVRDLAGNIRQKTATIELDTAPPVAPSIVADDGDITNKLDVAVTLEAFDATTMKVARQGSFQAAAWEPYGTSKTVTVTSSQGTKKIFASFADELGNETAPIFVAIEYDSVAPTPVSVDFADGAYINSLSATLSIEVTNDGPVTMVVSNDGIFNESVQSFAPQITHLLSSGDGVKTVNVRFCDEAGNCADLTSGSTILDTEAPTTPQIRSEGDSIDAASFTMELYTDSVTDANFHAFEMAGGSTLSTGFEEASYSIDATQFTYSLNQDSENILQIRAVDKAGNASSAAFIVIREDGTKPNTIADTWVVSGDEKMQINWTPSQEADVVGYWIYYGTTKRFEVLAGKPYIGQFADEGDSPIYVPGGSTNSFSLTGLGNGQEVYAAVVPVDSAGNEADFGNEVVGRPNVHAPRHIYPTLEGGYSSVFASSSGELYLARYNDAMYATGDSRLHVYMTNGATRFNPTVMAGVDHPQGGKYLRMAISGSANRLYVVDGVTGNTFTGLEAGIAIFDVSTATDPIYVGRVTMANTDEFPYGIAIANNKLYISNIDFGSIYDGPHSVRVYDLADPDNPVEIPSEVITYSGFPSTMMQISDAHDFLVLGGFGTLSKWDISGVPFKTGTASGFALSAIVKDTTLYAAYFGGSQIQMYDLSGTTPVAGASIALTDTVANYVDVSQNGNTLYTVGDDGYSTINISGSSPVINKIALNPYRGLEDTQHRAIQGYNSTGIYIGNGFNLEVHDASLATPKYARSIPLGKQYFDVDVKDGLVAVAEGFDGLGIYSLASGVPVEIGRYKSSAYEIVDVNWVIEDGYRMVYAISRRSQVASASPGYNSYSRLLSFNVTNPYSISLIIESSWSTARYTDILVSHDKIYGLLNFADRSQMRVYKYNLVNPTNLSYGGYCNQAVLTDLDWPMFEGTYRNGYLHILAGGSSEYWKDYNTLQVTGGGCLIANGDEITNMSAQRMMVASDHVYFMNYNNLSRRAVTDPGVIGDELEGNNEANSTLGPSLYAGTYLYNFGYDGVMIFDDEENMLRHVGTGSSKDGTTSFQDPRAIAIDGNYIVGVDRQQGLNVWQAVLPTGFTQVGGAQGQRANSIAVVNHHMVAGDYGNQSINVYDLAHGESAVQVSAEVPVGASSGGIVIGKSEASGYPDSVITKDNVGVRRLDVHNPADIAESNAIDVGSSYNEDRATIDGNRVYYVNWDYEDSVTTIEVGSSLVDVSSAPVMPNDIGFIEASGGFVFLALETSAEIRIYKVSGGTWTQHASINDFTQVYSLKAYGDRLYVQGTKSGGIFGKTVVYSLENTWKSTVLVPEELGSFTSSISTDPFRVHGSNLFFPSLGSWYDVIDPTTPQLLFDGNSSVESIEVMGVEAFGWDYNDPWAKYVLK